MSLRLKRAILRSRKSGFHFLNLVTLSEERTLMMLAVVVGLASGISAFIFKHMIDGVYHFCCSADPSLNLSSGHWSIGGLLGGLVIYFFAKEAKGHGVPEAIYAIRRRGGRGRPRVVLVKSVASAFTIGTGGSAGTEGPIIQIGAAVGSSIGQLFNVSPAYLKTLAAAGAAGGMAAVFNAPIAAVIFAMEVLLREFTTQAFSMVVFSSVIASVTSHILLGDNTFLPTPAFGLGFISSLVLSRPPLRVSLQKHFFLLKGLPTGLKKSPTRSNR